MNIQPMGINRFIVALSREDLLQLDITYDEMDYSNIETKRVIWTILDCVRQSTGRDVDPSGNLMIEATPDSAGGCVLLFTVPTSRAALGTVISKSGQTQIFEFDCADDLLDVMRVVGRDCADGKIFTDGKRYRAEFSCEKVTRCRRQLEEYGRFVGKDGLTAAVTHEHWRELDGSAAQ